MNKYQFREFSIGDLLVQEIPNFSKPEEVLQKRGIIIEISGSTSTIEWMMDFSDVGKDLKVTTIINSSLRRMIMDGYIKHFPVHK